MEKIEKFTENYSSLIFGLIYVLCLPIFLISLSHTGHDNNFFYLNFTSTFHIKFTLLQAFKYISFIGLFITLLIHVVSSVKEAKHHS